MSSEQNKAIVRRAFEEPWKGNLDVVDELIASDYVGHDPANPEPLRGPRGVKEFISTYLAAFPDARITVEQQLAEGELVATRWTGRGMHKGELMGVQATGKQVTVSGLTISRLSGDKIVEEFQNWDTLGTLQQLDAIPVPECIRTLNVTPLGGSQEQTMNMMDRLAREARRLDPGAVLRRWWRRLFRGARNGILA